MSSHNRIETIPFSNTVVADRGRVALLRSVTIRDGRVMAIDHDEFMSPDASNCPDFMLAPGMIDMHIHGVADVILENGIEAMHEASAILPRFGVTCAYPTLAPGNNGGMDRFLESLHRYATGLDGMPGARMPGLHLEGPFVAKSGAACLTLPGDRGLLDEMIAASGKQIRIMSLAPEVPGILPVIERLLECGIVPFVTHTQADVEATQAAIDAGARHATHFYDVFYAPEPTEPGVRPVGAVEAFLADSRCTVDFIADGVHVHPVAIGAALRAKGLHGVALITDANIGAGLPPGQYETPWGFCVDVGPRGGARIADPAHPSFGSLAGSALTLDQAVRNVCAWRAIPMARALLMATRTPARILQRKAGRIAKGMDADMVLWHRRALGWYPVRTWVNGKSVWRRPRS